MKVEIFTNYLSINKKGASRKKHIASTKYNVFKIYRMEDKRLHRNSQINDTQCIN